MYGVEGASKPEGKPGTPLEAPPVATSVASPVATPVAMSDTGSGCVCFVLVPSTVEVDLAGIGTVLASSFNPSVAITTLLL